MIEALRVARSTVNRPSKTTTKLDPTRITTRWLGRRTLGYPRVVAEARARTFGREIRVCRIYARRPSVVDFRAFTDRINERVGLLRLIARSLRRNRFGAVYVKSVSRADPIPLFQRSSRGTTFKCTNFGKNKLGRLPWHATCEHAGVNVHTLVL